MIAAAVAVIVMFVIFAAAASITLFAAAVINVRFAFLERFFISIIIIIQLTIQ